MLTLQYSSELRISVRYSAIPVVERFHYIPKGRQGAIDSRRLARMRGSKSERLVHNLRNVFRFTSRIRWGSFPVKLLSSEPARSTKHIFPTYATRFKLHQYPSDAQL